VAKQDERTLHRPLRPLGAWTITWIGLLLAVPAALPCSHAARNRLASSRRQKKQGRCPAANAVASSKNSSVQLRPPITLRRQPRNSQTQVIQAGLAQRFLSRVFVAGSWMMPRLPVNRPRCGVAMMSPDGVTRFCSGILMSPTVRHIRHCEERSDEAIHTFFAARWIASRSLSSGGASRRPGGSQ